MNPLHLSCSTPEAQTCLSLSIHAVKSAPAKETKSSTGELQLAATDSTQEGIEHVAR